MSALTGEWERALHEEFSKEYYKNLFFFIWKQYSETIVYPKADEIFTAFHLTPLEKVKVVILGQDPYHNEGPGAWALLFGETTGGNSTVS